MDKSLKEFLTTHANRIAWLDRSDFYPFDYCQGEQEAFDYGYEDGETFLARELLEKFFTDEHNQ